MNLLDSETPVGVVLGSFDATPLEFWVGVEAHADLALDDLVVVETRTAGGREVSFYGIVDQVRKRYEGTQFDSDAFRVAAGTLPAEISYAGHVRVTRVDPEVFLPPSPGDRAYVVRGEAYQKALFFDTMAKKLPIGLARSGQIVYADLEFLNGRRGAHASISGVSGVATKTTYATFLLYSLFESGVLGAETAQTRALIFNVKGEDLLWLDKANATLGPEDREAWARLGLPCGPFRSVSLFAPARRGVDTPTPDTGERQLGVAPFLWTLKEFARDGLLRFAMAEAEDGRSQIAYVAELVVKYLSRLANDGRNDDPRLWVDGRALELFDELVDHLDAQLDTIAQRQSLSQATLDAFRRRVRIAAGRIGHLVRSDHDGCRRAAISWEATQVSVIDIHRLPASAQTFVVGAVLTRLMERTGGGSDPLTFVVLDELNKYAPRSGWSPLQDIVLDIAERGRSLGVSLFGAQQTASEVERRVVGNAALRIVGRLDAAEAERGEYGFMTKTARERATILKPGHMIVAQPQIPTPLLVQFPRPGWATRRSEVDTAAADRDADPFAGISD
ncbi:MAG: ATP-binding protein [Deltaproteobacteria bacterium]|nr:ATP-binding protein [Deltaproteobacteria bacterium]